MTRSPHINFVQDRAAHQRRIKAVLAVLGLVFGLQLGLSAWRYQSAQSKFQELAAQYRQITGKSAQAGQQAPSSDQIKAATQVQGMLSAISVPWESLLSGIEAARTQGVVIDALQPNLQEGTITISVSAQNFYGVAELVQRLQNQAVFSSVKLESEALPENGAGSLRAVISGQWSKAP